MENTDAYYPIDSEATKGCGGIIVRDKLAESAMIGLLSKLGVLIIKMDIAEEIAKNAYLLADAMIKQSNL